MLHFFYFRYKLYINLQKIPCELLEFSLPHGISSKLDHFRFTGERTNGSHTILEVEHLSVSIIYGIHLLQTRIGIQHRFSRLNTVILYQFTGNTNHSPPLNAHSSAFELTCGYLETSFFLPVWMYSLPSKICAVPNERTLA